MSVIIKNNGGMEMLNVTYKRTSHCLHSTRVRKTNFKRSAKNKGENVLSFMQRLVERPS